MFVFIPDRLCVAGLCVARTAPLCFTENQPSEGLRFTARLSAQHGFRHSMAFGAGQGAAENFGKRLEPRNSGD